MTVANLSSGNNDEGISLSAPVIMELIEAVHEKGASFRFQAKGHSMTPAIRDGDIVTVSPLKEIMPRRGDVLAFRHPERPQMLVHRVLHTMARKYFVKGDNCPEADGWIPAENILGLISKVERQGRSRFWPNRSAPSSWVNFYLLLYPLWLPVRRRLVQLYRFFKNCN
ncbi:MAG: S26 family signal peptidase [Thermodesulfovibrionales bacterium]|nr:S26 family signal peptidase [Thermodesulfovibrionales bacterium]